MDSTRAGYGTNVALAGSGQFVPAEQEEITDHGLNTLVLKDFLDHIVKNQSAMGAYVAEDFPEWIRLGSE